MEEEFSRVIRASHIKEQIQSFALQADATSRKALAARFGLVEIAALTGDFSLQHERGGIIAASLVMHAEITQSCVVTLEPFPATLDESVALRFVPAAKLTPDEDAPEELAAESLEGPDEIPYMDDAIDLGAALAEQLALALDPYPRKPGAALPDEAADDSANPFAVLQGKFGTAKK